MWLSAVHMTEGYVNSSSGIGIVRKVAHTHYIVCIVNEAKGLKYFEELTLGIEFV